jgi:hypothetical protein
LKLRAGVGTLSTVCSGTTMDFKLEGKCGGSHANERAFRWQTTEKSEPHKPAQMETATMGGNGHEWTTVPCSLLAFPMALSWSAMKTLREGMPGPLTRMEQDKHCCHNPRNESAVAAA